MRWPFWKKQMLKDGSENDVVKPRNQILSVPDDVDEESKKKLSSEKKNLSDKEQFKQSLKYDVSKNDGKEKLDRKNTSNTSDAAPYKTEREVADEIPKTESKGKGR